MDIVFVSAELSPYSKVGGLGDVAGSLPRSLAARGHRVSVVTPNYPSTGGPHAAIGSTWVELFGEYHEVSWLRGPTDDNLEIIFVDNPAFHRAGVYGDEHGGFGDNHLRYTMLVIGALEWAATFAQRPVIQVNDWHTALLPVYLRSWFQPRGVLLNAPVVLGLHNMQHQGQASPDTFGGLNLGSAWWPMTEFDGALNPLKAGIVTADALVTVSPNYRNEILRDQGFGLEGVLRSRTDRLSGILNGIDIDDWNPARDEHLPARFSVDKLAGKAVCKAELQAELGLPVRPEVPMLGLVSRLVYQKGIDLVEAIAPWLLSQDVQLVMLGSGQDRLERFFREVEYRWPRKARGWVGFSERMAHRIEAGSDIYLMPSRFEPCGLNQMYSMRYGTIPVVHRTGGLTDTVITMDPAHDDGTGWAFAPLTPEAFIQALRFALDTFTNHPLAWRKLQRNGMLTDFSWDKAAEDYENVYDRVLAWTSPKPLPPQLADPDAA
ncbi:MAG: glycogen/starch synthase [Myxococcota bacterium]